MNGTTRTVLSTAAAAGILCLTAPVSGADGPDARIRGHDVGSPSTGPDRSLRGSKATSPYDPDPVPQTVVRETPVDDDALEYLPIGLGALAGMTVAGAGAVGLRRRSHRLPRPA